MTGKSKKRRITLSRELFLVIVAAMIAAIFIYAGISNLTSRYLDSRFQTTEYYLSEDAKIISSLKDYIKEYRPSPPKEYDHQYAAAKCLKCGLCLEVCPNYMKGDKFYGALFANDCYLIATRSDIYNKDIIKDYDRHFAAGCSKSLACMDVCPMKIPTLSSMAKLNRKRQD
jgi:succinate dehydrogenase / fumarate reductase iron-sulfur subunit